MRITLLIGSLENTGGAERSLSELANAWAQIGRTVTLLTFDRSHVPAYPLHPSIRCSHLGIYGESQGWLRRAQRILWRHRVLRRAIAESRPDIVVSFTPATNVRTILATRGWHVPVIVSERTDPSFYDIGRKWGTIRRLAYPFADALVCQTKTTLAKFQKMGQVKGSVIPNLIAVPRGLKLERASKPDEPRDHILIAMGRLAPQKGFDILLKAFSQIIQNHPSWSLKILGEGQQRNDLQKLAEDLKVAGRVQFAGVSVEPFAELCQADLFVLPSRFEGFPNALCEAMACGLPVVSFDCPAGPSDIVRNGIDGILVPPEDTAALATALNDLMKAGARRRQLAARAPEIFERFSVERVLSLWDEVLTELAPGKMRLQAAAQDCVSSAPGMV